MNQVGLFIHFKSFSYNNSFSTFKKMRTKTLGATLHLSTLIIYTNKQTKKFKIF